MEHRAKTRIGLVGPSPPPYGGMANQTRQLLNLLESEGIDVGFVQTNSPYRPGFIENVKGLRALFRLIPYLLRLWKLAGETGVFHIMANSGWSWQLFTAPAVWIAWLRNTRVIINYRGGNAGDYLKESITYVRPTMKKADAIVVPSGYLKDIFSSFGIETTVIPNIIDMSRFKVEKKVYLSWPIVSPHLVVTRNLEPIYGIDTAIKAVAVLHESIPEIKLTIAGSGPQKKELEDLVTHLGIENAVSFTGKLRPEDIVALYQSADIMLNPTTVDNMPNSLLEALACGIPIISTNAGGIPYLVEDERTALLVDIGDIQGMAKQVKRLLGDKLLFENMVRNGLEEAGQYTWPLIREKWLNVYVAALVT